MSTHSFGIEKKNGTVQAELDEQTESLNRAKEEYNKLKSSAVSRILIYI